VEQTPLARAVLDRLVATYEPARDSAKAAPMRAYMRHQFPFLGLPTPQRRALSRAVLADLPRPAEDDLRAGTLACWALPEREYPLLRLRLAASPRGGLLAGVPGDGPHADHDEVVLGHDAGGCSGTAWPAPATPDFFIRKAIGWALRQYAKSDPSGVRGFVQVHTDALSKREALKNL
jgi:3-methyladenine DNA glycosylase AlkD